MLEADVLLQGQGTPNQTDIPIMAHPPDITSDITLESWINQVLAHSSPKGIKLDFKGTAVLEPAMQVLKKRKLNFVQPVWLNADILRGPNTDSRPVNFSEFKRIVGLYFPESTWSLGWTTGWTNTPKDKVYNPEMVSEVADYVRELDQPITFPVRAAMIRESWNHFKDLLEESRGYTLTIWSGKNDIVNPDDLVYVRQSYDIDRIFYNLPDPLMNDFLKRLNQNAIVNK